MTTNNQYYKQIYEKVTGQTVIGIFSDNYYLKRIAEKICSTTYTDSKCNGRYLKDIAESATGETITGNHFNNYYLKIWAESITGEDEGTHFDNYYLGIIAEEIPSTKSFTISASSNPITYGSSVRVTAQLLDEEGDPMMGEPVNFYEGETWITEEITDSSG